jgi:membrane fusion protein, multidrug efflux system
MTSSKVLTFVRPIGEWNKKMKQQLLAMLAAVLGVVGTMISSGCSPADAQPTVKAAPTVRSVPVTVAPLQRKTVERTVNVVGSLRGWEHDMGDRVQPGEPLVELDPVDAQLAYNQAQSKFLAELVKLDITEERAASFVKKYGVSERLIRNPQVDDAIDRVPAVKQIEVTRDKALHNLERQRALSKKGASTQQELEDYESEYRSACASYDNAKATARNIIATAVANKVARDQAEQSLKDMLICVPRPRMMPPRSSQADTVVYALTRRSVSEGQMVKEGDSICELIIDNPLRLWTSVPERYADQVRIGQNVRISVASQPDITFEGKVVRINPSVDQANRTFQVETQVPNDRHLLRPGGFAKATIVTDSAAEAPVVPIEAIVRFAGVTKIFIVEDSKARALNDIVTRTEGKGWVEIFSKSLPASASVVTSGQTQLADQTPVTIRTGQ